MPKRKAYLPLGGGRPLSAFVSYPRTLADECASYFVLGLDGPTATTDEIKKAYRNLADKGAVSVAAEHSEKFLGLANSAGLVHDL